MDAFSCFLLYITECLSVDMCLKIKVPINENCIQDTTVSCTELQSWVDIRHYIDTRHAADPHTLRHVGGGRHGPGHLQVPRRLGQAGGPRRVQVSCDWWRAGHVTTVLTSDWSRCFLLSGSEAVTKADAEVLCAFHNGAWVAEIDRPGKINVRDLF